MYDLHIIRDHMLIANGEGLSLLDTGSPVSLARSSQISFAGRSHAAARGEEVLDTVTSWLNEPVHSLIGMDVLSGHSLHIDWQDRRLRVDDEFPESPASAVSLDFLLGVPLIEFNAGTEPARGFLDTGAHLSYAPAHVVQAQDDLDELIDFHPSAGKFRTSVAAIELKMGDVNWTARCGILPPPLDLAVSMAGGWIVGIDLFRDRDITLDFPNARLAQHPGR